MGRTNRFACVKCGANDAYMTFWPKWRAEYPGQSCYYGPGALSDDRKNKAAHLRITCGECGHEWHRTPKDEGKTTAAQRDAKKRWSRR